MGALEKGKGMSKYINLDDAVALSEKFHLFGKTGVVVSVGELKALPAAEVVEVHTVIDRMNEERKRAKGNWHTDPYWLGWVDAMGRAQRIVDGTIDDEPMYAPSTGEKREDNNE